MTRTRVHAEGRGSVLLIEICRPEVKNAIDHATAVALAREFERFDTERQFSVAVITGEGGYFSAGLDLRAFGRGEPIPKVDGRGFAGLTSRPPIKPVIAAVEGGAVGGGFEIVLACDLVVAARDARFALPEVKRGLAAGAGGLLRLPHRIPRNFAMELILTGDGVGAERLAGLGLINDLREPGAALEGAMALAERVAANGPLALQASKAIVEQSADWPWKDAFDEQERFLAPVRASKDAREGAAAFLAKRPPRFKGN